MIKKYLLAIIFVCLILNSFAQQAFEGKIIFDVSYPLTNQQNKHDVEKNTTIFFLKNGKMRMDVITSLGTSTTICDEKTGSCVMLTNVNGNKKALEITQERMDEEFEEHVSKKEKTKELEQQEKKEICGYTCFKKEFVFSKKTNEHIHIYYTNNIQSNAIEQNVYWIQKRLKKLKGIVLDYEIVDENNKTIYRAKATSIIPESLEDNLFKIPSEYSLEKRHKD